MKTSRRWIHHVVFLLGMFVATVLSVSATVALETDKLRIGTAREIITPELGGLIAGYGSNEPSRFVNDDLTVTAIAIEQGKHKVLLMSAAVCLINNDLIAKLRMLCGEAAGIPAANVIIAPSHTHSGPVMTSEYVDTIFIPKCVAVTVAAVKEMKPVTMGIATTQSLVGINRRQVRPNGTVILGQNPWGPYDSEMTVISFKGEDGKTVANIVHATAHPTAVGIRPIISRDWPGVMIDRLENESGAMTLFFNGAKGDIAPRMSNGLSTGTGISDAIEVGSLAGLDAVRAYKDIRVFRDETLSVVTGEVKLPHAPIMSLEDAESALAELDASPPGRWTGGLRRNLTGVIELHAKGETGESFFVYDQTLVRIGPVVFVPMPFEVSAEVSLRLRAYSKYGYTLVLGSANGSNSYLPTREQISIGGYEIDRFRAIGPKQLTDDADTHIINQNLVLMEKFVSGL